MPIFYQVQDVPVHSVLLLRTREEAVNYPKGDISLGLCSACGFMANVAFDPKLHEYSSSYESTQSHSPTFSAFARRLATLLIERYSLHGKRIIEIGCGQGEFLALLCELGGNSGVGFDPAYISGRIESEADDRITFIADYFSEDYANYEADFVCCKMTLEHIQDTAEFVSTVRRSIGDRMETNVFFQVPDVSRILREVAFWDIYYEHCSYFGSGSLARLFRRCGFDVTDLWKDYSDQYLMIAARPSSRSSHQVMAQEKDLQDLARDVAFFSENCRQELNRWKRDLGEISRSGRRTAVWGGGSKAVAFLTSLELQDEIEYVVDVNPNKSGTYIAGSGQRIVAPGFLAEYQPDVVVVMNPIYSMEIQHDLEKMDLRPELIEV